MPGEPRQNLVRIIAGIDDDRFVSILVAQNCAVALQ
jgi:hypothetical protein